jgi:hypothetical protein
VNITIEYLFVVGGARLPAKLGRKGLQTSTKRTDNIGSYLCGAARGQGQLRLITPSKNKIGKTETTENAPRQPKMSWPRRSTRITKENK